MSIKRFFSFTAPYCGFDSFATEAEARADIEACFDAVTDGTDETPGGWFWGELRGFVDGGEVVALDARPDSEAKSLQAELTALRARVGAVLAKLREMEKLYRQGEVSSAHGEYRFERAEAYEHAADLLSDALEPGGEAPA